MSGFPRGPRIFGRRRTPDPPPVVVPPNPASIVGVGAHRFDIGHMDALRDLGVRHVRTTFYEEDAPGGLNVAVESGYEILGVIRTYKRRSPEQVAAIAAYQAKRWPEVRAWQILNEVDVDGRDSDRVDDYAEVLRAVYPAVKQANPNALVVTSGCASDGDQLWQFLNHLSHHNAPFDVLALHAYGPPAWEVAQRKASVARSLFSQKPLWLTEYGFEWAAKPELPEHGVDLLQREEWRTVIENNAADRIFDRSFGHVLISGDRYGHGIYFDGKPKPAAVYLQEYLQQRRAA